MVDIVNGTLYLSNPAAKEGFFNHAAIIDGDHTIDSAVCAGPVTFTGTITVTGTLVIV